MCFEFFVPNMLSEHGTYGGEFNGSAVEDNLSKETSAHVHVTHLRKLKRFN